MKPIHFVLIIIAVIGLSTVCILHDTGYWGYTYSIRQDYRGGNYITEVLRSDGRLISLKIDEPENVTPQLVSRRKAEAQTIINNAKVIVK